MSLRAASIRIAITLSVLVLTGIGSRSAQTRLESYLPASGLLQFVYYEWDVRSASTSLNARRSRDQSKLSEFGLVVAESHGEDRIHIEGADDDFVIELLRRGDLNKDGIEDVLICFSEKAKVGTLASTRPLLLQKYSKNQPLIALGFDAFDPRCKGVR